MCDFHSVIVTGDGRILHDPSNSHSSIARLHGLGHEIDAKWWECEWDGKGEMPSNLVQNRRSGAAEPTQVAYRAAESHYRKLAAIVSGELDPRETPPFNSGDYADVWAVYDEAIAVCEAEGIAERIEPYLSDLSDAAAVNVLQTLIDNLSLEMVDIAADEIEAAKAEAYDEGQEDGETAGFDYGYETASDELYSWDYMQEEIESAVEKAREEWKETELAEEFRNGYLSAKRGEPLPTELREGFAEDGTPAGLID